MDKILQPLMFEVKSLNSEEGTFSAYGNVFNVPDSNGDITVKGTFAKTIESINALKRMPKLLAQHGHRMMPVGIITLVREDEYGLYFEGKFALDVQVGKEYHSLVKMGAIDQFSIGFKTVDYVLKDGYRYLLEVDLKEISIVTFACNEDSRVLDIKEETVSIELLKAGEEPTERLVQKSLQEAGLSKRQAEAAINAISTKSSNVEIEPQYKGFLDIKSKVSVSTVNVIGMDVSSDLEVKFIGDLSFHQIYSQIDQKLFSTFDSYDYYISNIWAETGTASLWSPFNQTDKLFSFSWAVVNGAVEISNLVEVSKTITYTPIKVNVTEPVVEEKNSTEVSIEDVNVLELKEDPMSWFNS